MSEIDKTGYTHSTPSLPPQTRGDVPRKLIEQTDLTQAKAGRSLDDSSVAYDGFVRQMRNKEMGVKDLGFDVSAKHYDRAAARRISASRDDNLFTPLKAYEGRTLRGRHPDEPPHGKKKKV
jgi:hypothetical protein